MKEFYILKKDCMNRIKHFVNKCAPFFRKVIITIMSVLVGVLYFSPTRVYALSIHEELNNKYGEYYKKELNNRISYNKNDIVSNVVDKIDNYYELDKNTLDNEGIKSYSIENDYSVYYVNGVEKPINTEIKKLFAGVNSSYSYANSTNTIKSSFPKTIDIPFKLTVGDTSLFLTLLNYESNSDPVLNGSELLYPLTNNVNLDVLVDNNKIRQNIVINSPIDDYSFSFNIDVENGYYTFENEVINIYDNDSNYLFTYYAPCAFDKEGIETEVSVSLEDDVVTYSIDSEWSNAFDRVYPITIDPDATIWGHSSIDVSVSYTNPTYTLGYENLKAQNWTLINEFNGYMYVGNNPTFGDTYTFFKIRDNSADDPLYKARNKYVKSVYVDIKIAEKNLSAGDDNLITCRLNAPFSETSVNYNNSSSLISGASDCVSYPITNDTSHIKIDFTDYVKDVIQNNEPNYGHLFLLEKQSQNYVKFYANEYQSYPGHDSGNVPGGVVYYYDNNDIQDFDDVSINLRPFVKYNFNDGICNFLALGIDGKAKYKSNLNIEIKTDDNIIFSKPIKTKTDFFIYPNYSIADPEILNSYTTLESNYQLDEIVDGFEPNKLYEVTVSDDSGHLSTTTFKTYEVKKFDIISNIAAYYGVSEDILVKDNNLSDGLLVEGNVLFIRNPSLNVDSSYDTPDLTEDQKKEIDASLTHRNKECEYGYEPINLNTGSYNLETNDITLNSGKDSISFTRIYDSKSYNILSSLGYGFRHNYDSYILTSGNDAIVYLTDGSELLFSYNGIDYINNVDDNHVLNYNIDHFELYDLEAQNTYIYNSFNKLNTIKYHNSKTVDLEYNNTLLSKIKFYNKTISFDYTNSLLTNIKVNGNNYVSYEYDDNLNLIKVIDPVGNVFEYTYDSNHNLLTYKSNNSLLVTNIYDNNHRVIKQIDSNNQEINLSYFDEYTFVEEPSGINKKIYFNSYGETTKIEYDDNSCEEKLFENKQLIHEVMTNGISYDYEYDDNSNLIKKTRSDGYYIEYSYDANNNKVHSIDSFGIENSYTYDLNNNLLSHTNPLNKTESYTYDLNSNMMSSTDYNGNTTTYTYNDNKELIKVEYPDGKTNEYAYNEFGYITCIKENGIIKETHTLNDNNELVINTYADGTCEKYEYNAFSHKTKYEDRNGHVYVYEYDSNQNLIKEISPKGKIKQYEYDVNSNMVKEMQPNGSVTLYTYSSSGNILIKNENDKETNYTYNNFGQLIKEESFNSVIEYSYDTLGNLSKTINNGLITKYEYDDLSRVIKQINPYNIVTNYEYNNNNLLVKEFTNKQEITYEYDDNSNLIKKEIKGLNDNITKTYLYEYDEVNNLIKETDPLGYYKTYTYEKGLLKEETDNNGNLTKYTYDNDNRLVTKTSANNGTTIYTYDGVGNLLSEKDSLNNITSYIYDEDNNLKKIDYPDSSYTIYEYDLMNNVSKEILPSGKTTRYEYDIYNNISKVYENDILMKSYEYNLAGYAIVETNSNLTSTNIFDNKNNLTSKIDPYGLETRYEYDNYNRLIKEYSNDKLIQTTSYTNNNFIEYTEDFNNIKTSYLYNDFDEVYSKTTDGHEETYEYDLNGSVVKNIDINGNTIIYIYDGNNNKIGYKVNDAEYSYEYDEMNNMTKQVDPEGIITEYTYDLNNNLLTKSIDGRIYSYTYDEMNRQDSYYINGELIEKKEYDLDGRVIKTYDHYNNYTQTSYDINGNVETSVNKKGYATTYTYDNYHNLLVENDSLNNRTIYEYNNLNQKISMTNSLNGKYLYEYNIFNELSKETNPRGGIHLYEYDDYNRMISEKDENGLLITYEYDNYNNISKIKYDDKLYRERIYDINGNLLSEKDSNNHIIINEYDSLNRKIKLTKENGYIELYEYDLDNRLIKETKDTRVYTYEYDSFNNKVLYKEIDNEYNYYYDIQDNLIKEINPLSQITEYEYDYNGNILKEDRPLGVSIVYEYDENNNIIKYTDELGSIYNYVYDELDRLIQIKDPNNNLETYTYDPMGNALTYKNKSGNTSSYYYDSMSNLIKIKSNILDDDYCYVYTYNNASDVIKKISYNNLIEEYSYDNTGNIKEYIEGSNSINYNYDLEGNLLSSLDNIYTYDLDNNIKTAFNNNSKSYFNYDIYGNLIEYKINNDITLYEYDDYNRLIKEVSPNGSETIYSYDAIGNIVYSSNNEYDVYLTYDDLNREINKVVENTIPSNSMFPLLEEDTTYDSMSNILSKTSKYEGLEIYNETNTYNNIGSLLTSSINLNGSSINKSYSYNNNDELVSSITNGNETTYYNTPFSNFTSYIDDEDTVLFEYNNNQSITKKSVNGVNTLYSYDNRGNRISEKSDTADLSYYYDSQNRLYKVVDNNTNYQTTYKYDALNNLISEDHINLLKDRNKIVNCSEDETNDNRSYSSPNEYHNIYSHNPNTIFSSINNINDNRNYYINSLISDSNNLYITNRLGSTVLSINDDGSINAYDYSDYGLLEDNEISIGYTGGLHLNNNQVYLNARIYDPTTFSFLNKDAVPINISDQSTFNEFAYCRLNPLKYVDPSGNSILGSIWNGVKSVAKTVVNAAKKVVNAVVSAAKTVVNTVVNYLTPTKTTNNTKNPGLYLPDNDDHDPPNNHPNNDNKIYNDVFVPWTPPDTNPLPKNIDTSAKELAKEVKETNRKNVIEVSKEIYEDKSKQTIYDSLIDISSSISGRTDSICDPIYNEKYTEDSVSIDVNVTMTTHLGAIAAAKHNNNYERAGLSLIRASSEILTHALIYYGTIAADLVCEALNIDIDIFEELRSHANPIDLGGDAWYRILIYDYIWNKYPI